MNEKYKDMLHLPHPVSVTHPRMSLQNRAAQFSPFAALTGYDDALRETARLTDRFIELDEDRKQEIDRQLYYIHEHLIQKPPVKITYFVPDSQKDGGSYRTLEGHVQKINETAGKICMNDTEIPINKIYQIDFT